MKKINLSIALVIIYIIIMFYIDFKIKTDLTYHSGKDGGFFAGLAMISIMSSVYFLVMSKQNKIVFFMIGLFIGVISYLLSYFATFYFLNSSDIYYYLLAMILFISLFHIIKKKIIL